MQNQISEIEMFSKFQKLKNYLKKTSQKRAFFEAINWTPVSRFLTVFTDRITKFFGIY